MPPPGSQASRMRSRGLYGSLQNLVLEGDPLGVVLRKPPFRGILIGKNFEVIWGADPFAGVDVNPDGFHLTILQANEMAPAINWTAGGANPEFFSRQGSSGAKTGSCELTPQQADVPRRLPRFPDRL